MSLTIILLHVAFMILPMFSVICILCSLPSVLSGMVMLFHFAKMKTISGGDLGKKTRCRKNVYNTALDGVVPGNH